MCGTHPKHRQRSEGHEGQTRRLSPHHTVTSDATALSDAAQSHEGWEQQKLQPKQLSVTSHHVAGAARRRVAMSVAVSTKATARARGTRPSALHPAPHGSG